MSEIIFYGDYSCPFCYLSQAALDRLRAEDGAEVELRPFELRPAPLPRLAPNDAGLVRAWKAIVAPLAEELGAEIRLPPVQPRTRKAHEAAAFAREHGDFLSMHRALFHAFFIEGEDIGRIDVLVRIGERVGLDPTALKIALDIDQYTERIVEERDAARKRRIEGVPAFIIDGRVRLGMHDYDTLRALVAGGADETTD